jgi:thioredoxin-like negative regulator of GroEL
MTSSPRRDPLEEIGLRFEVSVAEEHVRSHPDDLDALRALAYAYTAAGRLEEALAADVDLVRRDPSRADLRYDLACSYALLGRKDEAFTELDRALDLGFDDGEHLQEDPDLEGLHADPRWSALRGRLP